MASIKISHLLRTHGRVNSLWSSYHWWHARHSITELGQHWFKKWLVDKSVTSNHYLDWWWFIISESKVMWHSHRINFIRKDSDVSHYSMYENHVKIRAPLFRKQWFNVIRKACNNQSEQVLIICYCKCNSFFFQIYATVRILIKPNFSLLETGNEVSLYRCFFTRAHVSLIFDVVPLQVLMCWCHDLLWPDQSAAEHWGLPRVAAPQWPALP